MATLPATTHLLHSTGGDPTGRWANGPWKPSAAVFLWPPICAARGFGHPVEDRRPTSTVWAKIVVTSGQNLHMAFVYGGLR